MTDSSYLDFLFTANVLISMSAYLTVFVEGFLIPFQVAIMPRNWGPNWIYMLAIFLLQLEYFVWPLEINSYLFQTDKEALKILQNPENISRWS